MKFETSLAISVVCLLTLSCGGGHETDSSEATLLLNELQRELQKLIGKLRLEIDQTTVNDSTETLDSTKLLSGTKTKDKMVKLLVDWLGRHDINGNSKEHGQKFPQEPCIPVKAFHRFLANILGVGSSQAGDCIPLKPFYEMYINLLMLSISHNDFETATKKVQKVPISHNTDQDDHSESEGDGHATAQFLERLSGLSIEQKKKYFMMMGK